ncbi:MAG TPA: gamma-glutamyl-gamma-aminobutyrate hydrolase family protein [bacterium (Candidatus Stahlbacteria)]|nr:gamma-glutamyl-gamma-aminobutyrate hydrolase family protein [Candidatus Stahlbacteria bacterium]
MQPVIGITSGYCWEKKWYFLARAYLNAITNARGIPLIIPTIPAAGIESITDRIDGLLLSGGVDISPLFYGEEPVGVGKVDPERDRFEIEITKEAWGLGMPILAICRGIQVLNVALGGTLKQKIKGLKHFQQAERCQPSHTILIEKESRFYKIIKRRRLMVNSFHRDAIEKVAPHLVSTARSSDNIVEVLEAEDPGKFVLGVQFHPECMVDKFPIFRKIFSEFVLATKEFRS